VIDGLGLRAIFVADDRDVTPVRGADPLRIVQGYRSQRLVVMFVRAVAA